MKIALLGDIAFFGKFSVENNKDLKEYFKDTAALLAGYDLVIGNLETPFVNKEKPYGYKSAYIKSEVSNVALLKYLNIGIVNLANNHIYDFGKLSYELTKKVLKENDIDYFGVEDKEMICDFKENKISLNGYCCYSTNPMGMQPPLKKGINELNYPAVAQRLNDNSAKGLFNIFSFHIGQEHVNVPNYDHIEMARNLAEVGPYIFYGHHPHVAQGIEKHNGSLLAYSLGNFCFDDVYTSKSEEPLIKQTQNNKESFVLELEVENNKLISHKVIPIFLGDTKMHIGEQSIADKIDGYSDKLSIEKEAYIESRETLINRYIDSRKTMRDLNWYLKRLNYRSFFLLKSAKDNSKKYYENLKRHVK
tara:strand:+ start:14686 stop:15771 length:1086 start_codon:yes stop_codon:yes gene_type:complete